MNTTRRMAGAAGASTRLDFLDWLRVIAIFVLLFFHTGMLFTGWGWHIENAETLPVLQRPMDVAHRLRMPLLFVIAGAGTWFALDRRGSVQWVRERTLRLLVPLLVGMILIVPPQVYIERLFRGQWQDGYLAFYLERVLQLRPYPDGDLSWHHLWFVLYLYLYVIVLLPVLVWWKRRHSVLAPGAWLYLLALPLAVNEALLKPRFPESHNLVSDWYVFVHYLLLTGYGYLLASMPRSWDWLAEQRRRTLAAGLAVFAVATALLELGIIQRDSAVDALLASLFTWLWVLVFLGYGRRHLSFANGLLRWSRDASYPIYILHQTVIVVLAYRVVQQSWSPWSKYWVVLGATLVLCVLLYEYGIRRWRVTRVMFGMKAADLRPGTAAAGVSARAADAQVGAER